MILADDNLIVREGVCALLSMEGDLRVVGTAADLHDGAQQHLVALAVKPRMMQQLGQRDAEPALAMVEEPGATCRRRWGRCVPSCTGSTLPCRWTRACPRPSRQRRPVPPSPQLSPSGVSAVTLRSWRQRCTSVAWRRSRMPASTPVQVLA
ncbi:MAG: hypothetical protein KY452_10945 [Actinobacteria bacterium]|nr:hypothetical protein [Actinomycetota bacterium]